MKLFNKIVVILFVLASFILPAGCNSSSPTIDPNLNKAAIVDQLAITNANPEFIVSATNILESYGFEVDVWQGTDITVDFYHKLPTMGYRFIILRVHSGTLTSIEGDEVIVSDTTYLFTAENYTTTRYIGDQLADRVSNALMEEDLPLVFAVNSEFIKRTEGSFSDTLILAMGCESYRYDDMPLAFIEKGASAYIGWSDIVTLDHVDAVTLDLLSNLCTANMTVSQAVSVTMNILGNDPYFNSYLKYYPSATGNSTVADLIDK